METCAIQDITHKTETTTCISQPIWLFQAVLKCISPTQSLSGKLKCTSDVPLDNTQFVWNIENDRIIWIKLYTIPKALERQRWAYFNDI